jgi:hypothetical protein
MTPAQVAEALDVYYPARAPKGSLTATGTGLGVARALLRLQGGDLTLAVDGRRHALAMTLPAAAK